MHRISRQTLTRAMLALGLLALTSSPSTFALETANYTSPKNHRFADDPSFIGANYDWSGVGRTTNGRWATMLGDNYFITADHFEPTVGQAIQFKAGNSVASPTLSYTVAGRIPIAGTDIVIGYFNECVDFSIARYDYTTVAADSLADTGLSGSQLFISGDRVTGTPGNVTDHVVGTNEAETWRESGTTAMNTPESAVSFGSSAPFDQVATFENLSGDTANTVSTHESQLETGDSGSPLFSTSGTDLILQGIAWAVSAAPNDIPGNFVDTAGPSPSPDPFEKRNTSYFSYVGSYDSAMSGAIAMVPSPVCVPEPNSAILGILLVAFSLRRRIFGAR